MTVHHPEAFEAPRVVHDVILRMNVPVGRLWPVFGGSIGAWADHEEAQ